MLYWSGGLGLAALQRDRETFYKEMLGQVPQPVAKKYSQDLHGIMEERE